MRPDYTGNQSLDYPVIMKIYAHSSLLDFKKNYFIGFNHVKFKINKIKINNTASS